MLSTFPAAIGCEIPEVQNGKIHGPQSTYKAGETLHFDCNAGYAAEYTYEAQCQPGGTWDPPALICAKSECGWGARCFPKVALLARVLLAGRNSECRRSRSCDGLEPINAASRRLPSPCTLFSH